MEAWSSADRGVKKELDIIATEQQQRGKEISQITE